MKNIVFILVMLFMLGCYKKPTDITECVAVYYEELNSGTHSVVVTEGVYGAIEQRYFGKYIRNNDGTIILTGGGNIRRRYGLMWHTVKIDPNMPQLSKYLHKNCTLCTSLLKGE